MFSDVCEYYTVVKHSVMADLFTNVARKQGDELIREAQPKDD